MQGQIEIPDEELDALARKLGWTEDIGGILGPITPNPISQDQWVTNKAQAYLNNEAIAAAAIAQAETARQQAIADKTAVFAKIMPTVTTKSIIQPLPAIIQPPA